MTNWTREEIVESITDSIRRKEDYERKVAQEKDYQERLYELLGKVLTKKEMPRFDE